MRLASKWTGQLHTFSPKAFGAHTPPLRHASASPTEHPVAAAASVAPLQSTVPSSLQQPEAPEPTWPAGHGELGTDDAFPGQRDARPSRERESLRARCLPLEARRLVGAHGQPVADAHHLRCARATATRLAARGLRAASAGRVGRRVVGPRLLPQLERQRALVEVAAGRGAEAENTVARAGAQRVVRRPVSPVAGRLLRRRRAEPGEQQHEPGGRRVAGGPHCAWGVASPAGSPASSRSTGGRGGRQKVLGAGSER